MFPQQIDNGCTWKRWLYYHGIDLLAGQFCEGSVERFGPAEHDDLDFNAEGPRGKIYVFQKGFGEHVRRVRQGSHAARSAGVIPADRARYMAIGTAAQFELMLRQKDIIGEWAPGLPEPRLPSGISSLNRGSEIWSGFFTWEHIPGWRWRMKTSKSKYRAAAEFDLTIYGLLFPLLEAVPRDQRVGAIVKGEGGLPIRQSSYGKWYRQIARAAGIPDDVWNMDARAGGATEAEEAGAAVEDIQSALTHNQSRTTLRRP